MTIQRYCKADKARLFDLIKEQGDDWIDYYGEQGHDRYARALEASAAYVAYDGGYARCREDGGFGLYYTAFWSKDHIEGRQLGKMLVAADYAQQPVYVMSAVDPYYEKQGSLRVGSIFQVV